MSSRKPENEAERLEALEHYEILDTDPESLFDDITQLAAYICDAPIALMSLTDRNRQWFKSRTGLSAEETERDIAFCSHVLLEDDIMVVKDALKDDRFKDNPMVRGDPHIRFYAGAPLKTPEGLNLGSLCVIDQKPRTLSDEQQKVLKALSRQVMLLLELRLTTRNLKKLNGEKQALIDQLQEASQHIRQLEGLIPICASCKKIHAENGDWQEIEYYITDHSTSHFSHGICPDCAEKLYPNWYNRPE